MYNDTVLVDRHRKALLRKMGAPLELAQVVNAVFEALVAHISPRFSAFAALVAAIDVFKKRDFGTFPDYEAVWLPTTVLDDIHCVQYRTDVMQIVHDAIVPLCVSELARRYLQAALRAYDLQILFFCNGSFLLAETLHIRAFGESFEHVRREKRYSVADTDHWPVRLVGGFDSMPDDTVDLSPKGSERRLFRHIEKMLSMSL